MTEKINVLMTGAGAPGGPGIIKCLQFDSSIELYTCDTNDHATGKYLSKHFFLCPSANAENYIDFMLEQCKILKIDVLLPLVTRELFRLSKFKEQFKKQGTTIVVSDYDSLEIANNKSKLHQYLTDRAYSCADFSVVKNYEQLESQLVFFLSKYGNVCVKPSVSNGSRGVRIIDESVDEYDMLFNQKPTSLFTNKQGFLNILNGRSFPELLVSEVLPGEEYTVDSLIDHGNPLIIIPRVRTKMNSGISVAGFLIENQEIIQNVKQICSLLKLHGPIGFQFKKDSKGVFKLLEINPRIQGSSVTLMGGGVNLPVLVVNQAYGNPIVLPKIQWGIGFVRFYDEVYFK